MDSAEAAFHYECTGLVRGYSGRDIFYSCTKTVPESITRAVEALKPPFDETDVVEETDVSGSNTGSDAVATDLATISSSSLDSQFQSDMLTNIGIDVPTHQSSGGPTRRQGRPAKERAPKQTDVERTQNETMKDKWYCPVRGCATGLDGIQHSHDRAIKRHRLAHVKGCDYPCPGTCGRIFSRPDAVARHLKSNAGTGCLQAEVAFREEVNEQESTKTKYDSDPGAKLTYEQIIQRIYQQRTGKPHWSEYKEQLLELITTDGAIDADVSTLLSQIHSSDAHT